VKLSLNICILFLSLFLSNNSYPQAKPKAGGVFKINIGGEPTTLNPFTATDAYTSAVESYVVEGLLSRNPDTYEFEPAIAESYKVSVANVIGNESRITEDIGWTDAVATDNYDFTIFNILKLLFEKTSVGTQFVCYDQN
jgi:ABC-type transport system substrate-binding protein